MLTLDDFFHLPEVEPLLDRLVNDEPGLIIIAGLDPRPVSVPDDRAGFLPSGRSTIARIVLRELLDHRHKL